MVNTKWIIALIAIVVCLQAAHGASSVHTVITTECGSYFGWQSLGMLYSHRKSGQPGPLTRIMSCTPEEWEAFNEEAKAVMPTHVAPSYTHHPRTGDVYSAYNKPVAVIDWLARNDVKEDYVLIIDADMIMRTTFTPDNDGARPGRAVAAYFSYMKGVSNKLAIKHIPEVQPRNDTLAGPRGRRGDMVGGFTMMNTMDLKRVAPLWLKYTEEVRFDPDAWELTGDAYTKHPGDKPWISEMYGYSYGCAKADVWHICHPSAMLYPGYDTYEPPKVLHYGLVYTVPGTDYQFDKHWHYDFDAFQCPPWNFPENEPYQNRKVGLFPHPPHPSSFKTTGTQLLRDLLSIQVPITLNAAFCERHRAKCPPSDELERECGLVDEMEREMDAMFEEIEKDLPDPCRDEDTRCPTWAKAGECDKNSGYMTGFCPKSCKICKPRSKAGKKSPSISPTRIATTGKTGKGKAPVKNTVSDEVEIKNNNVVGKTVGHKQDVGGVDAARGIDRTNDIEIDDSNNDQDGDGGGGAVDDGNVIINSDLDGTPFVDDTYKGNEEEEEDVGGGRLMIPELKLRCTRFPKWSASQVRRCMVMAAAGAAYDPMVDDAALGEGVRDDLSNTHPHTFLDSTHDVGRYIGEGLSKVHIRELGAAGRARVQSTAEAAVQMGPVGMLACGGSASLVLALALQYLKKKRHGKGKGGFFRSGRVEDRND